MIYFPLPTLCEASHKVGKTTTAINLGAGLAKQNKKVLLIDADNEILPDSALLQHKEGFDYRFSC